LLMPFPMLDLTPEDRKQLAELAFARVSHQLHVVLDPITV
jgi:hypothetical protein